MNMRLLVITIDVNAKHNGKLRVSVTIHTPGLKALEKWVGSAVVLCLLALANPVGTPTIEKAAQDAGYILQKVGR